MGLYEMIIGTMFIPFLFILSIFFSLTLRKRNMQKIISTEISDALKDLKPREFFYNLLKMERTAKPVYYAEIFLLTIDTIYILFGGYAEYLKELKFAQEFPGFPINPMSFVFSELLPLVEERASWEVSAFANIFTKLNGQSLP